MARRLFFAANLKERRVDRVGSDIDRVGSDIDRVGGAIDRVGGVIDRPQSFFPQYAPIICYV
ncbi:hypothetical protein [Sporolactobacillus spathodeae]|uniref:t-SNARE coiled-coil homology domain-containing protein n=1 Tax=Sporolactobacillus spathodeae TaxID=1465502 RepID=A0ABS2Q7F6_9BACL|nr:hypothetical protein [Sporolactobacillus spathodeae]MBM7657719.1 hypothetical protein [Sporolactobacillus spathodeae]